MKRRYLYVSIFFVFGMLLTVFAFYSYRSYKNRNSQPVKSQVNRKRSKTRRSDTVPILRYDIRSLFI